jgi:hypothetical protein
MAGDVDLAGHQAADPDHASNHEDLKIKTFLGKKASLLAVVEVGVAQGGAGDTYEKPLGGNGLRGAQEKDGENYSSRDRQPMSPKGLPAFSCRFHCLPRKTRMNYER